tara:strand:- start:194 stop:1483 length:1290 start_codon:yes stop_codon:yes gene_type:complete
MPHNPFHGLMQPGRQPSMQFQQLNQAYQSDPRRILGQALMGQGASSAPVRTPLQGLGRLSSALVGAYLQRKAGDAQTAREDEFRTNLGNALAGIDLSAVPSLQALSGVSPELVLPAALNLETSLAVARAKKAPTETSSILSAEAAASKGLPTDRGQVYQQNNVTGAITSISGTREPSTGITPGVALQEIFDLSQKTNRTSEDNVRISFLNEIVKKPTIQNIPQADGTVITQRVPGFDAMAQLGLSAPVDADQAGDQSGAVAAQPDDSNVLGVKTKPLSAAETKFVSQMASAQKDLQTVIDIMFNGDLQGGSYNKDVAVLSGTGVGRAASGDAQRLFDAISNLVDLRLRDRTGATANQDEINNYLEAVVPGLTTRDDTARAKIERLVTELNANVSAFKQGRKVPNLQGISIPDTQSQTQTTTTVVIPGTN